MSIEAGINIELGSIKSRIYGGPYRKSPVGARRMKLVKMAEEIEMTCDIDIPIEDYGVPEDDTMTIGVVKAIVAMANGNDLYAGCMGGIGRTGLFMGCMAKVMLDYTKSKEDPVSFVRKQYMRHTIETAEQLDYVREFDTTKALAAVNMLQVPKYLVDNYGNLTLIVGNTQETPITTRWISRAKQWLKSLTN